jgi:hypothetical protein
MFIGPVRYIWAPESLHGPVVTVLPSLLGNTYGRNLYSYSQISKYRTLIKTSLAVYLNRENEIYE